MGGVQEGSGELSEAVGQVLCEMSVNSGKKWMFESHFDLNIWEKRS
jgi:hypothetical protein